MIENAGALDVYFEDEIGFWIAALEDFQVQFDAQGRITALDFRPIVGGSWVAVTDGSAGTGGSGGGGPNYLARINALKHRFANPATRDKTIRQAR